MIIPDADHLNTYLTLLGKCDFPRSARNVFDWEYNEQPGYSRYRFIATANFTKSFLKLWWVEAILTAGVWSVDSAVMSEEFTAPGNGSWHVLTNPLNTNRYIGWVKWKDYRSSSVGMKPEYEPWVL